MKSPLSYLLQARQCEIDEMERLADTCALVSLIGRYTHALQRERGITNIFLASHRLQSGDLRQMQITHSEALACEVAAAFEELAGGRHPLPGGSRLLERVALALHGIQGLTELRARVAVQALTPTGSVEAYGRVIAALLAVVFQAVDSAGDPEISRLLVALFNLMQGKEFAGQERALGAAVFTSGHIDEAAEREWLRLIEQQQRCLDVFAEFSDARMLAADDPNQELGAVAQVERLRRAGLSLGNVPAPAGTAQQWYECCTVLIDAMHRVEDACTRQLRNVCERKIAEARAALRDQEASMTSLRRTAGAPLAQAPPRLGPQLEQSVYDMVQEQSRRLQAMTVELDAVRSALNERKAIERAKGLLMTHRQLTEEEAYTTLRQMAMNQKRRIADVAQAVLAISEALPGPR